MDYNINSVNFFEDLKNTNIKMEDWKEIISSYKQLETYYIKNNEVDLLKDLNRQKKVILSYLDKCYNASIKRLASMTNELEKEFGNLDEVDTFKSPNKNIDFIKIAYKYGKWIVSAKNLSDNLEINNIPNGINNLISLVDRLDEQEAAYALNHAKVAGKFIFAALPYVRTDMPDTSWTTRYMKEPTIPLGPYEKSEDSVSTHNMPVSRQIAGEEDEILLGDKIETSDGDLYEIIAVSENEIITSTNENIDKTLAQGKLESGEWKKIESAKDEEKEDIRITRIKNKIEQLLKLIEEKLILDEAISRLVAEEEARLREKARPQYEKIERQMVKIEPKVKSFMAKIDSIREGDSKAIKNFRILKEKIGHFMVTYSRESEMRRVKGIADVEKVLEKMAELVSKRNLETFNKLAEDLFKQVERSEQFSIALLQRDPRNEERIEETKKFLKNVKTSQNSEFERNAAYNELEDLLVNNIINFNQYNEFTDYIDINARQVIAAVRRIKSNLIPVKADLIDNILQKLKDLYSNFANWITDKLNFLSIQEKEIKDINEDLERIIGE